MKALNYMMMALVGIASTVSGNAIARHYDRSCGNCGTVVAVEQVSHKDSHLGAGTAIGAVAGGLLGHTIGKGSGRTAATIGGAVAGGAVGHVVEKKNRDRRYSWRFSVNMDNGHRVTITQDDNPDIRSGDRVRVSDGRLDRF
ncbi:glycine zipper 2TM domain-containing protein [Dokdonella soli]|uniref:Glycine zipper 2TM domain-containing protein n=1 Tax=Dokdonella soli TaxID=529810 RepID=A0ABP3U8D7_9GAMM